jgi:hypothetical protein
MVVRGTLQPFNVDPSSSCLLIQETRLLLVTSPSQTHHAQIAPKLLHRFHHYLFLGLKPSLYFRRSTALEPTALQSTEQTGLGPFPELVISQARDPAHLYR